MKLRAQRLATLAVFLANGLGIGAWAVEIPRIKEKLVLSDAQLGLALLAFALGAIVAMPLAGRLAPRFGAGRAAAVAAALFALLLVLPALAPSLPLLFIALLLLGASNGATDVLMNAHASAIETRWGRPIMSSFHAAWSVGGLLGAALGGAIAGAGWSVAAGLGVPLLAVAALVVASTGLGLAERAAATAGTAPAVAAFAIPDAILLKLGAVAFLCMITEGAVADWSAVYLHTDGRATPAAAALGYASFALAMAVCRLIGDVCVRRFGPSRTVCYGGAVAAAGFAIIIGIPDVMAGCVGFVLIGAGLANVVPVIFSAAGRSAASPALGVAMAATAGYAGFLAGPPIIGFGAGLVGLRLALLLLVGATLLVAITGGKAVRGTP